MFNNKIRLISLFVLVFAVVLAFSISVSAIETVSEENATEEIVEAGTPESVEGTAITYDEVEAKTKEILDYVIAFLGSMGISLGFVLVAITKIKTLLHKNFPEYEKLVKNNVEMLANNKELQLTVVATMKEMAELTSQVAKLKKEIDAYNAKMQARDENIDAIVADTFSECE